MDLNMASIAASKVLVTDVGADGLQAGAPGDSANVAGTVVAFTDAATAEHGEADASYARMLRALLEAPCPDRPDWPPFAGVRYNGRPTSEWALGSVVEHRLHTAGVSGSNPLAPTTSSPAVGGGSSARHRHEPARQETCAVARRAGFR